MEKLNLKINSVSDIEKFYEILLEKGIFMSPDDSFKECAEPITEFDTDELDNIVEDCFKFCDENNIDIYGLAIRIFREFLIKNNKEVLPYFFESDEQYDEYRKSMSM